MSNIHWPSAKAEVVHHLVELLKLDTTNPPGNETLAVNYLAQVLRAEGIEPMILEYAPGRGNLVARLKGSGAASPLILYGHTDVVPAEPEYWTHPPFAGVIADGYIWGRGTADMKGTVAQQLMTFLLLKRAGVPLNRDVIFAATADEEIAGDGIQFLVRQHPDLIRAEWGITEIGAYTTYVNGRRFYTIQTAEKGVVWLKARVTGKPSHASVPDPDNAVVRLARGLERLERVGLPHHLPHATAGYIAELQALMPEARHWLEQLKSPATFEAGWQQFLKIDRPQALFLNALLHNTATPTGLSAGTKINIIPSHAEVLIDCRTLPGFTTEQALAELRAVLGDDFEYELILESPPLETPPDTPLFRLMKETLLRFDPEATVGPYMMSGATDAKHLNVLGTKSYGFSPLQLPPGFEFDDLMHSHNERIPVEGYQWGLEVLFEVVRAFVEEQ